ncbi:hypothetical protein MASR2M70_16240 [Bacillota bacterium]
MNQRFILLLLLIAGSQGRVQNPRPLSFRLPTLPKSPAYLDTFKMEMMLDRLHGMTDAIEKVNRLNQMQRVPEPKGKIPSIDRVQESLDAVKGFLSEGKSSQRVESLSHTLAGVQKLGNVEELMTTIGPLLSMIKKPE